MKNKQTSKPEKQFSSLETSREGEGGQSSQKNQLLDAGRTRVGYR